MMTGMTKQEWFERNKLRPVDLTIRATGGEETVAYISGKVIDAHEEFFTLNQSPDSFREGSRVVNYDYWIVVGFEPGED